MSTYGVYSFQGNSLELDKCVSVAMLGFQSVDDTARANQFMFKEGESKKNFYCGDHSGLCEYLLEHFCPPTGTVLDMSCDPAGMYVLIQLYHMHLLLIQWSLSKMDIIRIYCCSL